MTRKSCYVEAVVDAMHIAFPVQDVERVVRAVAVHPVPQAAGCLLGTIDVAGEIVPVYDLRRMLGLPARPLCAADRMLLLRAPTRCGLVVDVVAGTAQAEPLELTEEAGLHAAGLRGVARTSTGVLLVHEPRRLLALERAIPIVEHA
jgi:purine-binding chemotaxis protein CheW